MDNSSLQISVTKVYHPTLLALRGGGRGVKFPEKSIDILLAITYIRAVTGPLIVKLKKSLELPFTVLNMC